MNFNKHTFKVKEFLALPVYEEARLAPAGEFFLLKGKMSQQQDYLAFLIKEETEDKIRQSIEEAQKKNPKVDQRMKVKFWKKHKDGNVSEYGGTISFETEGIVAKGDKLVINMGDDDLSFKVSDEAMGIKEATLAGG